MTSSKYGNFGFLNLDQLPGSPLLLLDFGLEVRQNEVYDFDNSNRSYDGFLFQCTLSGYGCMDIEGVPYELTAGTAFLSLIPENSRYYLPSDDPDNRWEYIYCHFQGDAALPFYRKLVEHYGAVFKVSVSSPPIRQLLSLQSDMRKGRILDRYEGGEIVYRFLTGLMKQLEVPDITQGSHAIRTALAMMEEQYASPLSMEEIAEEAGLSTAYFTRLFTRNKGVPPIQYLTNIRLQHALAFLLNSDMTMEEIAVKCGFSCGNYFCKVFRKACGISPAEYRRQQRSAG